MRCLFIVALIGGVVLTQGCAGLSPDPPLTLEDRIRTVALLEQAKARIARGNTVIARGELHEAINLATRGKWLDLIADQAGSRALSSAEPGDREPVLQLTNAGYTLALTSCLPNRA